MFGVFTFDADAVVAYFEFEKIVFGTGPDLDVGRFVEPLRCGEIVDGFNRIFDQVDQHLVKLALLDANLPRCIFAVDVGMDPLFVERIPQYPEGGRERLVQVDVLASHGGTAERLLGADDIGDVIGPVPDAADRLYQPFAPLGEVFRERDDERHHFAALRVVFDVIAPVVLVLPHGCGQRKETASDAVVPSSGAQSQFPW